jgi:hypothetical protein
LELQFVPGLPSRIIARLARLQIEPRNRERLSVSFRAGKASAAAIRDPMLQDPADESRIFPVSGYTLYVRDLSHGSGLDDRTWHAI